MAAPRGLRTVGALLRGRQPEPLGRAYYGLSSFLCVPGARSQPGGYAMGAQAGPAAMERVAHEAGFTRFRTAAETPLNLVYEIRP